MAGMTFLQFETWQELENYCTTKSYKILNKKNEFPILAEVLNKNNALVGYISNRPQDFKPINPSTKYVLVWE